MAKPGRVHLEVKHTPPSPIRADVQSIVGTWLSLVERTLGVGEVASSNLVVPTIYFQSVRVWKKVNERGRGSKKVHLLHAADLSSFLFLTNNAATASWA